MYTDNDVGNVIGLRANAKLHLGVVQSVISARPVADPAEWISSQQALQLQNDYRSYRVGNIKSCGRYLWA